jgi:hypothetical protein
MYVPVLYAVRTALSENPKVTYVPGATWRVSQRAATERSGTATPPRPGLLVLYRTIRCIRPSRRKLKGAWGEQRQEQTVTAM